MAARMISSVRWACSGKYRDALCQMRSSHKLAVVPWARDEVRDEVGINDALERHSKLGRETEATIGFPAIKNGKFKSDNGHTIGGGGNMGQEWGSGVVSVAMVTVMTMLRMKMSLIFMILHVDNGGCTKEGGFEAEGHGRGRCWIWVDSGSSGVIGVG